MGKRRRNRKRVLLAGLLFLMMFSVMTVSAQAAWKKNSNGTYSYYSNGKLVKNKWISGTYYVNSKGVRQTGWLYKNSKWYFFTKSGKLIKNQWIRSSGKMYYASSTGALLVNGRRKVGENTYYAFDKRGVRLTGSRKYGGKYYFFGTKTGKMQTKSWITVNKKKYYYGEDGTRVYNSWVGRYYVGSNGTRLTKTWKNNKYLGSDGKAVSGLRKIGSVYYYFDTKTYAKVTNTTVEVNGTTYQFDSNGKGKIVSSSKVPAASVSVEKTYYSDTYLKDEELLASIIYCEAGNQTYEGKLAVGLVILNRVYSKSFPSTIREVVYQKNQFTPARNGALTKAQKNYKTQVTAECKKAAAEVLEQFKNYKTGNKVYLMLNEKKTEFPHLFFMTKAAYNSCGRTAKYVQIGAHVFFKTWS